MKIKKIFGSIVALAAFAMIMIYNVQAVQELDGTFTMEISETVALAQGSGTDPCAQDFSYAQEGGMAQIACNEWLDDEETQLGCASRDHIISILQWGTCPSDPGLGGV